MLPEPVPELDNLRQSLIQFGESEWIVERFIIDPDQPSPIPNPFSLFKKEPLRKCWIGFKLGNSPLKGRFSLTEWRIRSYDASAESKR